MTDLKDKIIVEYLSIKYGDYDNTLKVECDINIKNKVINDYERERYGDA